MTSEASQCWAEDTLERCVESIFDNCSQFLQYAEYVVTNGDVACR